MDEYRSRARVLVLVVAVFVVGTLGYWLIEDGWTLFDAFYMTAITISTVGYGEVRELSTAGRLFSVFLIFGGLGSAVLFASTMAQAFVERNFREAFEARRMQKMIQRLNDHYVVCGFGDIGSALCRVLKDAGLPFVVVEDDERIADLAAERGYPVVRGKATHDLTLMRAGLERAEGVVVCLDDDSVNVYVTLAARELPSHGSASPAPLERSDVEPVCVWTDSLSTGLEDTDAQLRSAFARLDALHQALVGGGDEARTQEAFRAGVECLTQHFEAQERVLADLVPPDAAEHVADHRALLEQLTGFDGTAALPPNLGEFLAHWLEGHIQERDRALGERDRVRGELTSAAS